MLHFALMSRQKVAPWRSDVQPVRQRPPAVGLTLPLRRARPAGAYFGGGAPEAAA